MSDSMLSQDEVDALFKQATGKSIVHMPSSAPSEKPVARPPVAGAPQPATPPPQPVVAQPAPVAAVSAPPLPPPVAGAPPAAQPPVTFAPQEIRPRPAAAPPEVSHAPVSQPHSDALVKQLEDMVSELTIRLAKAERRLAQLEQNKTSQQPSQNAAYSRELARMDAQIESMRVKLGATPGYNARNLFTCSSCGTSGQLSIPVKCTHCGEEGWWGWWPREKLEE
jgi:hypothetical protein